MASLGRLPIQCHSFFPVAIVGQGFGPAAELPLGAFHYSSAPRRPIVSPRAGQKASGRAEALPHDPSGVSSLGKTSGIGLPIGLFDLALPARDAIRPTF